MTSCQRSGAAGAAFSGMRFACGVGMLLALFPAVAAAAPLRFAWTSAEGTAIRDPVLLSDQRTIAFIEEGSAQVRLLDTLSWTGRSLAACTGSTPIGLAADGTGAVLACEDGALWTLGRDAGGAWALAADPVETTLTPLLGVGVQAGKVWLVVGGGQGNPTLSSVPLPLGDGADTVESHGVFGFTGFADLEAIGTNLLILSHGGDRVTKIDATSGSIANRVQTVGAADGSDLYATNPSTMLMAAGDVGVARFNFGDNSITLVIDNSDGIDFTTALAVWEQKLWVDDSGLGELLAFGLPTGQALPGDDVLESVPHPAESAGDFGVEMVALADHVVVATDAGNLWVLTDRPWVDAGAPVPASAGAGDDVSVRFSADVGGAWELRVGGTGDTDGDLLASGELEADVPVDAAFTVDGRFAEGANDLRVVVDDGVRVGRDVVVLTVDNPPSAVPFGAGDVGPRNQTLDVRIPAIADADLARYAVFFSTVPFSAADWAACPDGTAPCGPAYAGPDPVEGPVLVDAAPGEGATVSLYPLTNGETYYVAVRAIDAGGLEGPMSEVVEAVPVESFGAAALAGETGGCAAAGGRGASLAGLVGVAALLWARRRQAALGAAVVVAAAGLSTVAEAAPASGAGSAPAGLVDPADRHGTVALRMGRLDVQDPNINKVAEQAGKEVLWLDVGPRITRYGEITAGLGWFQELGYLVDENGAPTADRQMLTALPMTLNAGLRLDFVDDQPIVPFGGAGLDLWAWRENWQGPGDTKMNQRIGGWKTGWHWQVGGAFLLDRLDRSRASRLQARSGIDDTWATVEYRVQEVGADGLVFSGSWIGFGLRVDY